jgi:xylan 1,4-beta-xylosidase
MTGGGSRAFTNPVLPGFHPDPSICRVGDDFYLVTSSFEYSPGLPLFTSRDLVSWRQIGHCLTRPAQLDLSKAPSSGGLYAPTIRHHDGYFFVTCTNVTGSGHFIVPASDPAGRWSDPVWVDQDGIDPSLYFSDDRVYFTSTTGADPDGAHVSLPEFHFGVQQCEIDPFTGRKLTESRYLWGGTGGKYPEGPHLYRRGDYFYLLLAEGGTEYGHMVTVARSSSPWGPWESCPGNPVLTHRSTASPIQATGHADLVELADGTWWMVCLGVRPLGQWPRHHLGRETFLAPVSWSEDGWPRVGHSGMVEPRDIGPFPVAGPAAEEPTRDDFDDGALRLSWNELRTPTHPRWSLTEQPGWLVLRGTASTLDDMDVTFVGRRQQHWRCRTEARLDLANSRDGDEAGLTVRMNEHHHYEAAVRQEDGVRCVILRRRIGLLSAVVARRLVGPGPVDLRVDAEEDWYHFSARAHGDARIELGAGETAYLSTETAGGFTGVYLGLYASGAGHPRAAWDWFDYQPVE